MPSLVQFPINRIQSVKVKGQRILKAETEKISKKFDTLNLKVSYSGYSKIKTRIFPKTLANMFSPNTVCYDERPSSFKPELGSMKKVKVLSPKCRRPNSEPIIVKSPVKNEVRLCPSVVLTYQEAIFNENEHFNKQKIPGESFV